MPEEPQLPGKIWMLPVTVLLAVLGWFYQPAGGPASCCCTMDRSQLPDCCCAPSLPHNDRVALPSSPQERFYAPMVSSLQTIPLQLEVYLSPPQDVPLADVLGSKSQNPRAPPALG